MSNISRREFLKEIGSIGLKAGLTPLFVQLFDFFPGVQIGEKLFANESIIKEINATWSNPIKDSLKVQCTLCPHNEILSPNQEGICRGRFNRSGKLISVAYNRPCVINIDPIGKNPLGHYYPNYKMLALAHAGCNLLCNYCQNWQFSQSSPLQTKNIRSFNMKQTLNKIKGKKINGVSFTYTEAVYTIEFVKAFSELCKDLGLKRTICTAGYINQSPLKEMINYFDAFTVTYKGATNNFYKENIGGTLEPVLQSMQTIKNSSKWLEIATLIIPGLNDDDKSLKIMAKWIKENLGADTPWHLEKFEPQYKLRKLPPTSQKTMEKAKAIGDDAGLNFVYISNLSPHIANHTYCPTCKKVLVKRMGFNILENKLTNSMCYKCFTKIPGHWN